MTGSVTFSTGIGGDGSTVTDDDNATTGLRDGGWRTRFVPCFTNQVSIANYVVTQANAAGSSATAASSSASSASSSASAASSSASAASSSASAASSSASAASTSASNASTSASTATTQAGIATTQANNAASSASAAASSATASASSASDSLTYKNAAAASAVSAASAAGDSLTYANQAAASYDSFDDRYLGAKASDPTLDNDGNALLTGALYWNSASNVMKVYSGSAWLTAYLPASGYATNGKAIAFAMVMGF